MRVIRSDEAEGRDQQDISCSVSELYELYELCIGIWSIYEGCMCSGNVIVIV